MSGVLQQIRNVSGEEASGPTADKGLEKGAGRTLFYLTHLSNHMRRPSSMLNLTNIHYTLVNDSTYTVMATLCILTDESIM